MDRKAIEQIIYETLEKCGVRVPVEAKFDYSECEQPAKAMEFVRLTDGDWRNAIYVSKDGERRGDAQYFDLLYIPNENGEPICIPVPVARKLFNQPIGAYPCKWTIPGHVYETIYRHYYQQSQLPF
jgi:hypothetical protein